jgi:hypothetical protein
MSIRQLLVVATALLPASCSSTGWQLAADGYSVIPGPNGEFAFAVHQNQLKQFDGGVKAARFRLFVSEHLKWEGLCPRGWEPLPCTEDGSCISQARFSVTIFGRCIEP